MTLPPAPERLLGPDGSVAAFGMWSGALKDVDLADARVKGRPGVLGRFRLKRWQHVAVVHPDAALTFAIVDAGFLRIGWVQGIDRKTGEVFEHHFQSPFLDVQLSRSLWDERCVLNTGRGTIEIHNDLDHGRHGVRIELEAHRDLPAVQAELEIPATSTSLVVNLPVGRGRSMYSHKVVHPAEGSFRFGERAYTCSLADTGAIFDVHKAHYPRKTWWNWATFVGRSGDRVVGLNLTKNVVTDPAMHENAVWVDGELSLLGPARFSLPADGPWTMGTEDGSVELAFEPEGARGENIRAVVVESVFAQKYGRFSGRIGDIVLDEAWGLVEDHHSTW